MHEAHALSGSLQTSGHHIATSWHHDASAHSPTKAERLTPKKASHTRNRWCRDSVLSKHACVILLLLRGLWKYIPWEITTEKKSFPECKIKIKAAIENRSDVSLPSSNPPPLLLPSPTTNPPTHPPTYPANHPSTHTPPHTTHNNIQQHTTTYNNTQQHTTTHNNNNTIWGGSVLTGGEPPRHSGELNHALSTLCCQDTTSPWSTDYGGNIHH